jgi:hypothetical protein
MMTELDNAIRMVALERIDPTAEVSIFIVTALAWWWDSLRPAEA